MSANAFSLDLGHGHLLLSLSPFRQEDLREIFLVLRRRREGDVLQKSILKDVVKEKIKFEDLWIQN